jgi:DNA polymerase III subunit epsilon
MGSLDFTALDFETATNAHNSICQVGLVVVNNGIITKRYSSFVKPPQNKYEYQNILVHKIEPYMTDNAPDFTEIWKEIDKHICNKHLVCHNTDFDLLKLNETLAYYNIPVPNYTFSCTYKIFKNNLKECCKQQNIELFGHHDALYDAIACALLYIKSINSNEKIFYNSDDQPYAFKRIEKEDLIPNFDIQNSNNPFYKKKVVFTGDLIEYTREEAAHKIKLLGADVNTSISKKTDLVVIGRNPGPSKLEKINQFQIKTISEEEFMKMINE